MTDQYINNVVMIQESERRTLRELSTIVSSHERVALMGFSEFAKHLVNMHPGKIVAIIDADPLLNGVTFRGIKVVDDVHVVDADAFVACTFDGLIEGQVRVADALGLGHPYLYPTAFGDKPTRYYKYEEQNSLYRAVFDTDSTTPTSMMKPETIILLVELLWRSLATSGAVYELGVWQGGSVWHFARALHHLGDRRNIILYDFFEELTPTNPKAVMCTDEIRRRLSFYPSVEIQSGDLAQIFLDRAVEPACFIHIDLGYKRAVLEHALGLLQPGGTILLDNYRHIKARPVLFDRFFQENGMHLVRSPFSTQAWAVKMH